MRGLVTIVGLQLVLVLDLAVARLHKARDDEPIWADIPASSTFEWVPCYDQADCARLLVPMDYENPDKANVTLAVIRHRARDQDDFKGTVFLNSGVRVQRRTFPVSTDDWQW
jgi:hypothetical protein